jgi:translation elongation factor EF-G
LDEEQTKQLQKQIDDQKAYNELNSVDKIKADYEAKRQVLQTELDEKVKAFEKESKEFLVNELKKEIFEKKWLDYMRYSVTEQKKMTDQLI